MDLGTLNPKQKQFCQSRSRYTAYGGARGGGKTHVLLRKAAGGALTYPGIKILIVRREYPELEQNIILPMQKLIPPEVGSYNGSMRMMFFCNGSIIKFGHYGAGDDQEYQGLEFDWIFMEEATQFSESQFRTLGACLRGATKFPRVKEATVLTPSLEIKTISNKDLNFHYRTSFLKENKDYICLEATLILVKKDTHEIMELIKSRKEKRLATQPLNYPSAGSVFRNPKDDFAGRMIEELNLKGYNINGAEISSKHANFIINKDKCSGKDIVKLINLVKDKVKKEYNIDLILEQEIIT